MSLILSISHCKLSVKFPLSFLASHRLRTAISKDKHPENTMSRPHSELGQGRAPGASNRHQRMHSVHAQPLYERSHSHLPASQTHPEDNTIRRPHVPASGDTRAAAQVLPLRGMKPQHNQRTAAPLGSHTNARQVTRGSHYYSSTLLNVNPDSTTPSRPIVRRVHAKYGEPGTGEYQGSSVAVEPHHSRNYSAAKQIEMARRGSDG